MTRYGSVGLGEYDLALGESLGVLEEATTIGGEVVILSGAATLESLMTDRLDRSVDEPLHRAGLRRKAAVLADRWADHLDQDALRDHIDWLADRRNAFARNFIDGHGPWPRDLPAGRFEAAEVEEACGASVTPPHPAVRVRSTPRNGRALTNHARPQTPAAEFVRSDPGHARDRQLRIPPNCVSAPSATDGRRSLPCTIGITRVELSDDRDGYYGRAGLRRDGHNWPDRGVRPDELR